MDKYTKDNLSGNRFLVQRNAWLGDQTLYLLAEGDLPFVINGKEEVKKFVYAMAVLGDLIEDGNSLILPGPRKIPEDGLYVLCAVATEPLSVTVLGGRLLVPTKSSKNFYVDSTEEYLKNERWVLKPMEKLDK